MSDATTRFEFDVAERTMMIGERLWRLGEFSALEFKHIAEVAQAAYTCGEIEGAGRAIARLETWSRNVLK